MKIIEQEKEIEELKKQLSLLSQDKGLKGNKEQKMGHYKLLERWKKRKGPVKRTKEEQL